MSLVRLQWYVCSCQNIKKGVCGFAVEASFLYQEGKKSPWLRWNGLSDIQVDILGPTLWTKI